MSDWNFWSLLRGDGGITQTANAISQAARFGVRNQAVIARAQYVVHGCATRDENCEVERIFRWTLSHFRYLRDPLGVELIKSPEVALAEIDRVGSFQGDCDDVTTFLAAMLMAVGYRCRAVVMAIPGKGSEFRHVYLKVFMPKVNAWKSLEATAPRRPIGWNAASERTREYDL